MEFENLKANCAIHPRAEALGFLASKDKLDSIRNLVDAIREETKAIHMEMKDFHNRLCEIEKKR